MKWLFIINMVLILAMFFRNPADAWRMIAINGVLCLMSGVIMILANGDIVLAALLISFSPVLFWATIKARKLRREREEKGIDKFDFQW